jgi:hypothetical protein
MARVNIAFYWSKTTQGKSKNEGWYLVNNLSNLKQTIKAYSKRMGIEAMFKDCKSGGYNLEQCQAKDKRLLSLILLIAIAYTCTINKGQTFAFKGIKEYICRLKENLRKDKRHSNFWVGLYGESARSCETVRPKGYTQCDKCKPLRILRGFPALKELSRVGVSPMSD